ncbi:serine/threonine protein kinase [Stieleria sp. JC731]|uniref:serine/threonine protein kinase n=1 Tax=Pirellulaceae TaxID=2691357 RepID=UPI001E4EA762|nr:serine/threonine-protein kinase [Stieleria sp. JC731]MCC9600910.1 serine/threonine protein kinase [Stieleria sp. JC731]
MVKIKSPCLDSEQLNRVINGDLPKDEFDSAISHLDECDKCRLAAENLDLVLDSPAIDAPSEDSQLESLRNETACQVALGRLTRRRLATSQSSPPIDNLGTYRLLELVGSGGMGAVFKAEHQRLRRQCAIKLLPPDRVAQQGWLDRFNREMTAVASLEHPGIVRATDAGHDSGWHYLVMEYLDGLDVGQVATRMGQLAVADACEIVRQAAKALAHIHDCGLVHRDIKPSNLMLTRDGQVKVLDLGLVLDGDDPLVSDERLTTVGHVMGTMPYMAPEQLTDSRDVNPKSDLYSLGATLFRLIAGRPPHRSGKGLAAQVLEITGQDAPALDTVREDVDREVVNLVAEILARDPKKRPLTAEQIAERLEAPSKGHQLQRLVREAIRKETDSQPPRSGLFPNPSGKSGGSPPRSRYRWLIGLAMAGCLVLAGFVIKFQTDRGLLVVHSGLDGLTVAIKQDDKLVDELEIKTGDNKISLYKGEYRIEIQGGGEAIQLSDEVVTIGRSGVHEVNVENLASSDPASTAVDEPTVAQRLSSGSDVAAKSQEVDTSMSGIGMGMDAMSGMGMGMDMHSLLFDGKRLSEWNKTIASTDDWEELGQAMTTAIKVVDRFGSGDWLDKTIDAIILRSRDLGGLHRRSPPVISSSKSVQDKNASLYFMWYYDQVFAEPSISQWNERNAEELLVGNSQSRSAIVVSLHRYYEKRSRSSMGGYGGGYGGMMSGMGGGDEEATSQRQKKFLSLRLLRGLIGLSKDEAWEGFESAEQSAASRYARESAIYIAKEQSIGFESLPELVSIVEAVPEQQRSKLEADLIKRNRPNKPTSMGDTEMYGGGRGYSAMEMGYGDMMEEGVGSGDDMGMMMGGSGEAGYGGSIAEMGGGSGEESPILYRGKPLKTWRGILRVELDVDSLLEAIEAVAVIARNVDEKTRVEIGRDILFAARIYGGTEANGTGDPSGKFMQVFPRVMAEFFPANGFQLLEEEFESGNQKSINAMLWPLADYLRDHDPETILAATDPKQLRSIRDKIEAMDLEPTEPYEFWYIVEAFAQLTWLLDESVEGHPKFQELVVDVVEASVNQRDYKRQAFTDKIQWPPSLIVVGLEIAKLDPNRFSDAALSTLIIRGVSPAESRTGFDDHDRVELAYQVDSKLAAESFLQYPSSWILLFLKNVSDRRVGRMFELFAQHCELSADLDKKFDQLTRQMGNDVDLIKKTKATIEERRSSTPSLP